MTPIVLDSSVLVAILLGEPGAEALSDAVLAAPIRRMSAATLVEVGMVMQGRRGDVGARELDLLLAQFSVETVPLTAAHAALARDAFRTFGKGRHPAGLNLGDCFSYALAVALDEPLLFVGDDFGQTDVRVATS